MAISLCIKGREEMTKNIIIKTSVQKRFDSFMAHGRVLFFSAQAMIIRIRSHSPIQIMVRTMVLQLSLTSRTTAVRKAGM
mgnify:CR=1 FL=1